LSKVERIHDFSSACVSLNELVVDEQLNALVARRGEV